MIKKLLLLLVLLMTAATNTWATDGIECSASDIGKVLCTDGSIYATVSDATAASKTAAAVIVYVDETNKKGLAIALADEGTMNWSTAKSTCEGKTAITGVKWCLPSQNQWEQMFQANGGTTAENTVLNSTITTAGGTPLQENATYWSSSEKSPGVSACTVVLISDIVGWGNGSEDKVDVRVRACLAFAPPTYAVTLAEGTEDAKNWTIASGSSSVKGNVADGLTGLKENDAVTVTYTGRMKVKSVTATTDAVPGPFDNVTASDKGKVIGADGKIYADAAAATAASTTAVAMIAYVGNDAETNTKYNHGLAIALTDASTAAKWDTNTNRYCLSPFGSANAAKGDMAGIANTDAIVKDGHTHAAASAARNYNSGTHPDGTSEWFLPSAGQWDKMITAAGGGAELRTKAGLASDAYWSSSESSLIDYRAWQYNFSSNGLYNSAKTDEKHVRAVLAF